MMNFSEQDEYKRKVIAENLIKILSANEVNISPVVLDGSWGSGKTKFCTKLQNLVHEKKSVLRTIYIDAFKYDYSSDPLIMLVTEILKHLKMSNVESSLVDNIRKSAIPLIKIMSKTVLQAGTAHLLKVNAEDLADDVREALSLGAAEASMVGLNTFLKENEELEKNINSFKGLLEEASSDKKLIIIIDELDRCRPSFALETLEKVKHVFDVPNVRFIFSTNLHQLGSMVKKQYGFDINAELYLSKFYSCVIRLPEETSPHGTKYENNSFLHLRSLVRGNPKFTNLLLHENAPYKIVEKVFITQKYSLRDAERLYNNLLIFSVLHGQEPFNEDKYNFSASTMMMLGALIYTFNGKLVDQILNEKLKESDILDFFALTIHDIKKDIYETGYVSIFLIDTKDSALHTPDNLKYLQNHIEYHKGSFPGFHSHQSKLVFVINTIRTLQFRL